MKSGLIEELIISTMFRLLHPRLWHYLARFRIYKTRLEISKLIQMHGKSNLRRYSLLHIHSIQLKQIILRFNPRRGTKQSIIFNHSAYTARSFNIGVL